MTAHASGFSSGSLLTGFAFYAGTMIALTAWDEHVVPKLQDAGVLPEMPGSVRSIRLSRLSKEQRELPWFTPLTADRALPDLETVEQEPVRVGQYGGVTQFIKAHAQSEPIPIKVPAQRPTDGTPFDAEELCAVCKVSKEFSDHYGRRIYLCKRKTELGKF